MPVEDAARSWSVEDRRTTRRDARLSEQDRAISPGARTSTRRCRSVLGITSRRTARSGRSTGSSSAPMRNRAGSDIRRTGFSRPNHAVSTTFRRRRDGMTTSDHHRNARGHSPSPAAKESGSTMTPRHWQIVARPSEFATIRSTLTDPPLAASCWSARPASGRRPWHAR